MRSYRRLNVHKIMYVNLMFLVWSQILKICKSMLAWCISFTQAMHTVIDSLLTIRMNYINTGQDLLYRKSTSHILLASLLLTTTSECVPGQTWQGLASHQSSAQELQWRHNGWDSVSNHQPHHTILNRWFRRRSNKTSKPRVTGLCAGNLRGTGEFSAQMASNAENISIWWCHHG